MKSIIIGIMLGIFYGIVGLGGLVGVLMVANEIAIYLFNVYDINKGISFISVLFIAAFAIAGGIIGYLEKEN